MTSESKLEEIRLGKEGSEAMREQRTWKDKRVNGLKINVGFKLFLEEAHPH